MTDKSAIPNEVNNFYDRTLLDRVVPRFLYAMFAQVRPIKSNAGTSTIKFRRYGNLTAATTPLQEGVTPAGSSLSVTDITATAEQYGDFTILTDVVDYTSQDPVLTEIAGDVLADQALDTFDILTREVVMNGTSVRYGGDATDRDEIVAGDVISETLLKQSIRELKNNNAKKISEMVNATTGISTTPLNAAFVGIIHPNISYTLDGITGYIPVEKYASTKKLMEGEIGAFKEIRFVESTNAKIFEGEGFGGVDVYATLIFGKNAYGISQINGQTLRNIIKGLGSGGTNDPLNQRATSGWKATFVAKILNNAFMVRLETGVAP